MRRQAKGKYLILFLLFLIIFLGAILRFYRIKELGTFRGDQATELLGTAQILRGDLTLIGIKTSISEVRNGAVMYYLMAPFLWLFRFDPVAGGVVQSLLSLATIVIVFFLGKSLGGEKLGLVAAFLIATSALLVDYSRQTMLAHYPLFFVSLSLLLFWQIINRFSRLRIFLLGFLLGFMLQIHYSTLAVFLTAVAFPFLFLKRTQIFVYFLALLPGFILGFSPMIAFELRHEFFQTKMFVNYLKESSGGYFLSHLGAYFSYWPTVLGKWGAIFIFFLGVVTFFRYLQGKLGRLEKLCLLQIAATALFIFLLVKENAAVHYAISAFVPIVLLTVGALFSLTNLILIVILAAFFLANFPAYQINRDHGGSMSPGWNLPGVEKAAKIIAQDADKKEFNVAMVVDAENQGLPLRFFLFVWEKSPLGVEYYGEAKTLYVVAEPGTDLKKIGMWEITAFGPFCERKIWPIQNGYKLYRLEKLPGDCLNL